MAGKKTLAVLGFLLLVYGGYSAVLQGRTFYRDYQDFKTIRVWVLQVQAAAKQQRQVQQAKPAPTSAPTPPSADAPKGQ
jgi:hypothetical protein